MKINPIQYNTYNINFNAKLSEKVKNGFEFLEIELRGFYGENSKQYKEFQTQYNALKTMCKNYKISVKNNGKKYGKEIYDFCIVKNRNNKYNLGLYALDDEDLFNKDNFKLLYETLKDINEAEKDDKLLKDRIIRHKKFHIKKWFQNLFKK